MKIRLSIGDVWKILLGGRVVIKHPFATGQIFTISKTEKGRPTYMCKG